MNQMHDPPARRCEVELLDGRVFDLTGKTPAEAIAVLRALAITSEDILETRHYLGDLCLSRIAFGRGEDDAP